MENNNNLQGILWAICGCLFVSIMISIVRKVSYDLHFTQILMMRCLFSLILFFPLIIKTKGTVFQTTKLKLHIFRSLTGFIAMLSWFYVVTKISLPEAVSITFIVPILTTLLAAIIFKEVITTRLYLALFIGFIGMLIIVRPGFVKIELAHLMAILSAILWSISNILTKELTKTDRPRTVVLYLCLIILFCSIPISLPNLKAMNMEQLIWLFFLGLSANIAHYSLSMAYGNAKLSILQPFDFSRLIFISIIAYFAFGELIDIYTIIGSIIIIIASVYLSLKKPVQINVRS